jgi:hypothetical protein
LNVVLTTSQVQVLMKFGFFGICTLPDNHILHRRPAFRYLWSQMVLHCGNTLAMVGRLVSCRAHSIDMLIGGVSSLKSESYDRDWLADFEIPRAL